jgi:hypothetical protein
MVCDVEENLYICGSSSGTREIYTSSAQAMGKLLAERSLELVYGWRRAIAPWLRDFCAKFLVTCCFLIPMVRGSSIVSQTILFQLQISRRREPTS